MQVSCSNCGAQYEFDASAIPESGYDAQCTTCNAVFFVHPDPDHPKAAAPARAPVAPDQVVISCQHCGAVYQFSANDIPAAGYDAQCTQCQGIFFVSPDNAAKVASGIHSTPETPAAQPQSDKMAAVSEPPIITETTEIPIVDEKDFASISQVMAMEKLQAQAQVSETQNAEPVTAVFASDALSKTSQGTASEDLISASSVLASSPSAQASDFAALAAPFVPQTQTTATGNTEAFPPQTSDTISDVSSTPEASPIKAEDAPDASQSTASTHPADATFFGAHPEHTQAAARTSAITPESPAPSSAPDASRTSVPDLPSQAGVAAAWMPNQLPQPDEEELRRTPQAGQSEKTGATLAATGAQNDLTHPNASRPEDLGTNDTFAEGSPLRKKRRWLRYLVVTGCVGAIGALAFSQQGQLAHLLNRAEKATLPQLPPLVAEPAQATQQVVSAAAQKAFERGMLRLIEDTNQGYADALDAFEQALKQDPTMVDAYAGMALQALLSGQDVWTQGQAEWAQAKQLEINLNTRQPKILALAKARQNRELERERARYAEDNANLTKLREAAILHLQMGKTWHTHGLLLLMRGIHVGLATPLLQATSTLWAASDPYLTVAGEADHSLEAANAQLKSTLESIATADAQGAGGASANAEPWAPMWVALAQARILAANPATAEQAIPALQKAVETYPKLNRGLWEQSVLQTLSGQSSAAKKTLEGLLKQCPDHDKARAALASSTAESDASTPAQKTRKAPRHRARRR